MGFEGYFGDVVKIAVFAGKMALFIVFYMLIRWTIPRFRFDQLMAFAWKGLIPLTLLNVFGILILKHLTHTYDGLTWDGMKWLLLPWSFVLLIAAGYVALRLPKRGPPKKGKFYHRSRLAQAAVNGQ